MTNLVSSAEEFGVRAVIWHPELGNHQSLVVIFCETAAGDSFRYWSVALAPIIEDGLDISIGPAGI